MTSNSIVCHVRTIALAIAAVVLSVIVQIAGFVAPGWIYLDNDSISSHTGLWYYVICLANSGCTHGSTPKDIPEVFLEYQIMVAIALAAIMWALLFLIVHCVRRQRNLTGELVTFLVIAIICCITSGILAMIAAGRHGYTLHRAQKSTIFPYALFLTGLGGVIATLVGLFLVIAVNQIAVVNKYVQNGTPVTHM